MTDLPSRLKYWRASVPRRVVAEQMQVSPSMIAKWENGSVSPKAEQLQALAAIYGCSMADLLGDQPTGESARLAARIDGLSPELRSAIWSLIVALDE